MKSNHHSTTDTVRTPLQEFLRLEGAAGILLMIAAALAMIIANSPLDHWYAAFLDMPVEVRVGTFELAKPLFLWINDGLMAVFFFLVGLELKREVLQGHLSSMRQASLPALAAFGGMVLPAAIFAALNWNDPKAMPGAAIPTATDIAFALGVLSLLGNRVPAVLKAFLLGVAIFDDLGAIILIAVFYTSDLALTSLLLAAIFIAGLAILNWRGVRRPAAYLVLGVLLWIAVLKSGVHATLAGVVLAFFIPIEDKRCPESGEMRSMLKHLEHTLHPWVAFGVLPIFAFANAGIPLLDLSIADVFHPVPLGIVLGLFIGKQVGVMAMCWLSVKMGFAERPKELSWGLLYGASLLCGIGFTMSLFIASLAFEQGTTEYFGLERLGIVLGSLLSGVFGVIVLRQSLKAAPPAARD
ncbi:MAG: Na+/H+ antiporter NhaA [Planctomycetes bacterium]|nr:Na+/H+ antiporter NhaA [Planctomycetota bacterium]